MTAAALHQGVPPFSCVPPLMHGDVDGSVDGDVDGNLGADRAVASVALRIALHSHDHAVFGHFGATAQGMVFGLAADLTGNRETVIDQFASQRPGSSRQSTTR